MKTERIGSRGVLFTLEAHESAFASDYCVYLIEGENTVYLCDTHVGPRSMEPIGDYMRENGLDKKELVIFFSHSDWDHVWGACAFPEATVVAQHGTLKRLYDHGHLELQRYAKYQNGDVRLVYPTITFESKLSFCRDGVEFIFAPGHTSDSAICHDRRDSVLYLGDLVEVPHPEIQAHDLETYIETLEGIGELKARVMITAHSGRVGEKDIQDNIAYIQRFQEIAFSEPAEQEPEAAKMIRKQYTLLMYEDAIAETAGDKFDYPTFQKELWGSLELDYLEPITTLLKKVEHEELKLALESYMAGL